MEPLEPLEPLELLGLAQWEEPLTQLRRVQGLVGVVRWVRVCGPPLVLVELQVLEQPLVEQWVLWGG